MALKFAPNAAKTDFDLVTPVEGAQLLAADLKAASTASHSHANKTELDLLTDGDHDVRIDNPHTVTAAQAGAAPTVHTHVKADVTDFAHAIGGSEHSGDTYVSVNALVTDEELMKHSDIADPGNAGRVKRTGGSTWGTIKDASSEIADPTASNDNTEGYEVGSIWLNTTADRAFVCIDAATGAAIWLRTGSTIIKDFQFFADQLENPVNAAWAVNALAPAVLDSNDNTRTVRAFDDTTEEGVGFSLLIPVGVKSIVLKPVARAEVGPPAARTVGLKLYAKDISDDAAPLAWDGGTVLTDIDIPTTNEFYQYDSQTITLASLGFVAGKISQFELTRIAPTGGTNLVGDWDLLLLEVDLI